MDKERMKKELQMLGMLGDCLRAGSYAGSFAEKVAVSQQYVAALTNALKDAIAAAEEAPVV